MPIHCHAWTWRSNATLECTSPAKRFTPKTVNEKKFLSTQSLAFILIINWWALPKLTNTIKKTDQNFYNEDKNKQVHSQIKIHHEHLKNINKIEKYKKMNRTEHKTGMNITKIDKYKKAEQHFYDGAQNRHEHY